MPTAPEELVMRLALSLGVDFPKREAAAMCNDRTVDLTSWLLRCCTAEILSLYTYVIGHRLI